MARLLKKNYFRLFRFALSWTATPSTGDSNPASPPAPAANGELDGRWTLVSIQVASETRFSTGPGGEGAFQPWR